MSARGKILLRLKMLISQWWSQEVGIRYELSWKIRTKLEIWGSRQSPGHDL